MKIFILVLNLLCFSFVPSYASETADITGVENSISERAMENIVKASPEFSFYGTVEKIKNGNYESNLKGMLRKGADMFLSEIRANAVIMGCVMMLGILCSFISNLASSFKNGGVSDAAFLCCYAVLAGLSATGFKEISECAKGAIEDMGFFIKSLVPFLSVLSASEGRVITASVLHTEILVATAVSSYITERVILPLVYASFALKFINNITENKTLANFSVMADKFARRILSFTLLIFTAVLSLSGFAAGTVENMGMKTARFAVSSFVPVAGGALADSVSAVTASFGMIKNSAGIAGIMAILLMAAYPVIKCAAVSFIYSFTGALIEPLCDTRLSRAVTSVGEVMGMLFGIVSISAAQYVIASAILLFTYGG